MPPKLQIKLKTSTSETKIPLHNTKIAIKLKPKVGLIWSQFESLIYHINQPSSKLAVFDLDGTLINTLSESKFATDLNDWKLAFTLIPQKLQALRDDGYSIMIISNQAGVEKGHISIDNIKDKLNQISQSLGGPISIFLCTSKNQYRKPMKTLWDRIMNLCHLTKIENTSFYCGDAAGRPKNYLPGKSKDFNNTDRYFAHNNGLDFKTPEEIFMDMKPFSYTSPYLNELKLNKWVPSVTFDRSVLDSSKPKLIIMAGPPASGKSTLSQFINEDKSYIILNNDTIKNSKKLNTLFDQAIKQHDNIILDNTNNSKIKRCTYLESAKQAGYQTIICFFKYPKLLSIHLNQMRLDIETEVHKSVPLIAIHTYYKNLEEPTIDESNLDKLISFETLPLAPPTYYYNYYDIGA